MLVHTSKASLGVEVGVVFLSSVSAERDHERVPKGIEEVTHELKFLSTTSRYEEEGLSEGYVCDYENKQERSHVLSHFGDHSEQMVSLIKNSQVVE